MTAPRQFDIKAVWEQRGEALRHLMRALFLAIGQQPRDRALAGSGESDQPVGMAFKISKGNMRFQLQRTIEMRPADEVAQIVPAILILRIQRQIVDRLTLTAQHAEKASDDWLHPFTQRRPGKHGGAVETIAVAHGDGRKSAFLGEFCDGLRIDSAFEHRIAGHNAQRYEGSMWHPLNMRAGRASLKRQSREYPLFR